MRRGLAKPDIVRGLLMLGLLLALAGCGDGDDADLPTLSVDKGTVRITCGGGDCFAAIVGNEASVTRTIDGISDQRFLVVSGFTNVEFVTGGGNDVAQLVDVFVPGTIHISTGPGDDRFDICDATAGGDTSITAGPGNDQANIDADFRRSFRLDLGEGDDVVSLSRYYAGPVRVDGGPGDDAFSWFPFPGPPAHTVVVGFEHDDTNGRVSESYPDRE